MNISSQAKNRSKPTFAKAEWRHVQFDIAGTRLLRQRLLEIGQSMVEVGILQDATEIFDLSPEDVRDARSQIGMIAPPIEVTPSTSLQSAQFYW